MSSSAQGNARSGFGAESNCIYDDAGSAASGSSWSWTSSPRGAARGAAGASGHRGRSSLAVATSAPWNIAPSSGAAEPSRDGLLPATSSLRQSFLSRNRQPEQFGSVVLTKPSRLEPIRTCLTWIWLGPVIVTALAGLAVLFGMLCLTEQLVLFDTCGEILVPLGLFLPCAALLVAIYMSQPSTAGQQHDAFYSDALLEEVLAGENILDVYTVTTRGCPPRDGNVVVFLSGIGGVAETWRSHVEAVVDAGFAAIQIQLPGSGCLGAITFSFERAAQTVMRVIEQEVLDERFEQDCPLAYGAPTAPGGLFANAEIVGAHHLPSQNLNPLMSSLPSRAVDTQTHGFQSKQGLTGTEGPPRRLVLVAWGLSCHVAMYLASSQRLGNAHLAGIVLCGSPPLPSWGLSWSSKLYYRAFRVSWIAQLARLSEYARMGPQNRRSVSLQSLRPQARADWGVNFEHSGESLRLACSSFLAPVLCLSSDPSYLDEVRAHFGGPLQESGSNVDGALLSGGRSASTQSFPPPSDEELVAHILDFASMAMA